MQDNTKTLVIETPRFFRFKPYDDITSVEAAWLDHFFARLPTLRAIENYEAWSVIQRHFEEEE